jgi:YMGG-like Gly-zipper
MKTKGMAVALGLLLSSSVLMADTLRLKNGTEVSGTYLGGDTRQVKFLGADGQTATYSVADLDGIEFTAGDPIATAAVAGSPSISAPSAAPSPAAAPPRPAPAVAAQSTTPSPMPMASVTIPAGTTVTVRMIDSIDTDVTGAGERFRASIDDPIVVNGQVVVPRNADATVQVMRVEQSGKISGSDEVAMKLYDITIDGKPYEVASEYAEVKGEGQGKKTAKTTAVTTGVGAALGAIFGGGKGAAIGAGAGAATGVAVSAARGKTLRIPSETRLDFDLRAPLPVK